MSSSPRRRGRRSASVSIALCAVLVVSSGCSSDDTEEPTSSGSETTSTDASQYGSSMGVVPAEVDDVAALGDGPAPGETWTVPVGLSICGRFVDPPAGGPTNGVTANADGTVTVTPPSGQDTDGATLDDYATAAGLELSTGSVTLPDDITPASIDSTEPETVLAGTTFADGDLCGTTPGEVQVWVYSADAAESGDGIMAVTTDPQDVPFSEQGMSVVVAFAPESSLPTLPPAAVARP